MRCAPIAIALCFLWICNARSIPGCTDEHVWIVDGSVDCKYLYTVSFWGLHLKPEYYCTKYPLTNCCATCADLGYVGKKRSQSNTPQNTPKATMETTTPTTTMPAMKKLVPVEVKPPGTDTYVVSVQPLIQP